MIFRDRQTIESVGRQNISTARDHRGLRAKQLGSFWLYVDEEDSGYTKHALKDGYWESWITLWMDKNVPSNSTCLDIGANHGYYSFYLSVIKNAKVYAFEPQPKLAELIRRSEEANGISVNIAEVAISDSDGTVEMMVPIHHGMNATISNQFSYAPDGYEMITVETWPLDECFDTTTIDFIKVDAEGAEDLIWAGSKDFRRRQPQAVWLMEWRWDRYKNPESFAKELLDNYSVSAVTFDGNEQTIDSTKHLKTREHEDWMLVLRSHHS